VGSTALASDNNGSDNTAVGFHALSQSTGGNVTALGVFAGSNLTSGSNDIYIVSEGAASESNTIRIGNGYGGTHTATYIAGIAGEIVDQSSYGAVVIDATGKLGTVVSSRRFKQDIRDMGDASDAILSLRPVTFHYKRELDPKGVAQFGLVAEEVEKVNPALVVRDARGQVSSVRYDAVNAMLLNEFLKQHDKVAKLEASNAKLGADDSALKATIAEQKEAMARQAADFQNTLAQQQLEIKALTASLKEQSSLLQKVSAGLQAARPEPRMAASND
jgi:hypothetical protein